jgi:hypothetical protein
MGMFTLHGQRKHTTGHDTDDAVACAAIAQKVHDAAVSILQPLAWWGSSVQMDRVDVYHLISSNGKADQKAEVVFTGDEKPWGSTSSNSMPWESALCVELFAYPVGVLDPHRRRKRGRIFLPCTNGGILDANGSGEFEPSNFNSTFCPAILAFLNSIQGCSLADGGITGNDSLNLGILSRTFNEFHQLEFINVSNKYHHQRRREHKQGSSVYGNTISHS